MANKKNQPEWFVLIKAQDEASKFFDKEAKEITKKGKILYKGMLDQQLYEKTVANKDSEEQKLEEKKLFKQQEKALKDFENKKKIDERNYQKVYFQANQQDLEQKYKKTSLELIQERENEQKRLLAIKSSEEKEKIEEIQSKNKKIAEHRTILEKQLEEKQKKAEFDRIQKEKDKALIDQAIEEMKKKEQNYKNFYDKRTAILEQKNRLFQPIFDKDLINQELINKRTEEWEKATKEAQVLKEKQSWTQKLKAANEIKSEWNKQIEWKNKKKLDEWKEGLKDQDLAKLKAEEDHFFQQKERLQRKQKMEDLKFFLEKQVIEKQQELGDHYMNTTEKKVNKEVLDKVLNKKIASFAGIPGIALADSPAKHVFHRALKSNDLSFTSKSDSVEFRDNKVNQSMFSVFPNKKPPQIDLNKHNTILNPIGSSLPRVLPGQRIVRGLFANSSLINAGTSIFNNNL